MSRAVRATAGAGLIVAGAFIPGAQPWLTGAGVAMLSGAIFDPSIKGSGPTGPRPVPLMVRPPVRRD